MLADYSGVRVCFSSPSSNPSNVSPAVGPLMQRVLTRRIFEVRAVASAATVRKCRMKRGAKKEISLPKRAASMLARLKGVRGLSEQEKSVHALGLAATPEERWNLFENFVRSAGYWRPLRRKRSSSS